jgi:nitroimidazol reductase NimA-like FMN-containing flavoprotein (pyridoxamine 5'-phosphate oxidase superfamily)
MINTQDQPMPKNYNLDASPPAEMRRPEYAQDDRWIRDFFTQAEAGHVGSRWEDQPFVTPILFWYNPQRYEIYFHTKITGRLRANIEHSDKVCIEAYRMGRVLPANTALEFALQYESVVAFGRGRLLQDDEEKRYALYGLIEKYFPKMKPGEHYRPITEQELKRTAVYAIAIESWSGKRNWPAQAKQSEDWSPLGAEWFEQSE